MFSEDLTFVNLKKNRARFSSSPQWQVQYSKVSTVQCIAVQYSAVQCSAAQRSATQRSAVQYSTVQYSTVQYSTIQDSKLIIIIILVCEVVTDEDFLHLKSKMGHIVNLTPTKPKRYSTVEIHKSLFIDFV